jgi:hypothetical protein
MFQRGICTVDDLVRASQTISETRPYLRRPCYIGLYEAAATAADTPAHRLQEAILERFAVANGSFKRTSGRRFGKFDELTLQVLRGQPALRHRFVVHDMAISDGRTACEWYAKLSAEFGDALEFYGTDLCFEVTALRVPKARTTVVLDNKGSILQLIFPPFVLPTKLSRREKLFYPLKSALRMALMSTAVGRVMKLYSAGGGSLERHQITLTCPELRARRTCSPNFHIETYDAFELAPRQYSVVRAMNIFNRSYFSDRDISLAIENIFRSLTEDGVFVTGSNSDAGSTVDGAIYVRSHGGVTRICSSGAGSQIDHLLGRVGAGSRDT